MGLIERAIGGVPGAGKSAAPDKVVSLDGLKSFEVDFGALRAKGVFTPAARDEAQAFELRAIKRRLLRRIGFLQRAGRDKRQIAASGRNRNIVLLTSTRPGEGKTYDQYIASGELPIPTQIVMFSVVVLVAVVVLWVLRGKLSTESPTNRQQSFEVGVEAIRGFLADLVGPGGIKHFPVVMTFAILIFLSNLLGMLPDMISPTANFNVTLALAITSFGYYNWIGIKENGLWGHIKHFAGPIWWLIPLMFPIEIISNMARILSLSIRLFGNIYGEEQVSGAVAGIVPWGVPALLMPLGLLTAFLQTFIFVLLSMVYLGEVSHHDGHEHGHESFGSVQSHEQHAH